MELIYLAIVAVLAAGAAALSTAVYYRRRTQARIGRLSNMLKHLALDPVEHLGNLQPEKEADLPELTEAIVLLSNEIQSVIQRISAERNTMAALLQNMSDGIISVDFQGYLTNINSSSRRILGLPAEAELVGRPFMQVVRDHEVNSLLQQTLQDGQERTQMLEIGPWRPQLQVKVTLIDEEDKKPAYFKKDNRSALVVLQDLTEIMRLERIRRDFVANISHELRTPLASVKLMVETLQNVIEDDPTAAPGFLLRIDTEIDGLTQLVRELLELSRIESGQIKLNLKATDLRELVEQAAERMSAQAARSGLTVQVSSRGSEESFPDGLVDPDRLMQVLINLIHNAIKFTPVGGVISLSVQRLRQPENGRNIEKLVVKVSDTGVGIPPDDLGRVFERFYKVDKARAGTETGTGLGLAIAKHIIQAQAGEIWAESEYGKGSSFIFTVPALELI